MKLISSLVSLAVVTDAVKIWHGEETVALWEAYGGNEPGQEPELIFDDDMNTIWQGSVPASEPPYQENSITVTFHDYVNFYYADIYTRPDSPEDIKDSYQRLCIFTPTTQNCTDPDATYTIGNNIPIGPFAPTLTKSVELVFLNNVAQIADLKLYYWEANVSVTDELQQSLTDYNNLLRRTFDNRKFIDSTTKKLTKVVNRLIKGVDRFACKYTLRKRRSTENESTCDKLINIVEDIQDWLDGPKFPSCGVKVRRHRVYRGSFKKVTQIRQRLVDKCEKKE